MKDMAAGARFPFVPVLLWPLLAFMAAVEYPRAMRSPRRFSVSIPGRRPEFSGEQWFPRKDEAVSYARKLADGQRDTVFIANTARSQWKRDYSGGPKSWKLLLYEVSPSGSVERFKYPSLLDPTGLRGDLTDAEFAQACLLRAIEWEFWPLFLSQSVVPILYLIMQWKLAWWVVGFFTSVFFLFRFRLANIWVAHFGQIIVKFTRWPVTVGIACFYFWKAKIFLGILTLATVPVITVLFWLAALITPKSGTRKLQHIFLAQAGYDFEEAKASAEFTG